MYERLTPPSRKPTFMTLMVTQLVSGIWHGLYPGYIMFFAGACQNRSPQQLTLFKQCRAATLPLPVNALLCIQQCLIIRPSRHCL